MFDRLFEIEMKYWIQKFQEVGHCFQNWAQNLHQIENPKIQWLRNLLPPFYKHIAGDSAVGTLKNKVLLLSKRIVLLCQILAQQGTAKKFTCTYYSQHIYLFKVAKNKHIIWDFHRICRKKYFDIFFIFQSIFDKHKIKNIIELAKNVWLFV